MQMTRVLPKSAASFERSEGTPRVAAVEIREAAPISNISAKEANKLLTDVAEGHYLATLEYNPKFCLVTPEKDALAVYSPPVPQHFKKVLPGCLELTRLWQSDARRARRAEVGPLSEFLNASAAWVAQRNPECPCLFSYTDPYKGHTGLVYQMARWRKLGMSRVTDYWLDPFDDGRQISSPKMYRLHKTKSRSLLTLLGYELVERPPKILYCKGLALTVNEVRGVLGGRYGQKSSGQP